MAKTAKEFVERSNLRGFLAIARDWTAIVAIIAASEWLDSPVFYVAAVWLIGSFQFALSEALMHEASHYNLFRTRALNDRMEFLFGLPFFRTVDQLRREHVVHHRRLGTPEDQLVADYEAMGLLRPDVNVFWIWFIRPILGYAGLYYVRALLAGPWKGGRPIVVFWAVVLPVCYALGALDLLVLYWLIPFGWACSSFLYWSEITDHYRAPTGTRSSLGWLGNFLHHNNGYHYTHHHSPAIPWYRLPEATRELFAGCGDVTYGFIDTYRAITRSSAVDIHAPAAPPQPST
ncbi:MAG TPA: fatty acid desaturase [Longimicrobium sp.]|nr:fatty acid desaturase [Longimicrobium sp.]